MKSKLPHTERKSFNKWAHNRITTNGGIINTIPAMPAYNRKLSRATYAAMKKAN